MIEAETSSRAVVLAASLIIGLCVLKDAWTYSIKPLRLAVTWSRGRWQQTTHHEEYVGRHRWELAA